MARFGFNRVTPAVLWCVIATTSFATAGCLTLPTDGPARQVSGDGGQEPAEVPVVGQGPSDGASATEVVQGFLQSFAASGKGYQESLKYIHPEIKLRWNPQTQTGVYDDADFSLTEDTENSIPGLPGLEQNRSNPGEVVIRLEAKQLFHLDRKGVRYRSAQKSRVNQTFVLKKHQGEWRIHQLSDGVFIAKPYFDLAYRPFVLYFGGSQPRQLVPDVRWLLKRDGAVTQITEALLAGPGGELDGLARNGFPAGTTLAAPQTVRIRKGVAEVNLREIFKDTTPEQRALAQAQLKTTLQQLKGINDVQISVDSAPLDIVEEKAQEFTVTKVDTSPLIGLRSNKVFALGPSGSVTEQTWAESIANKPLAGIAVKPGSGEAPTWYAATTKDHKQLAIISRNAGSTTRFLTRTTKKAVTAPSIDAYGYIWLGERDGKDIWVYNRQGVGYPLARSWGADSVTRIVRISPDGARLAVASQGSDQKWHLTVAGVSRSDQGRPQTLAYERSRRIGARYDRIMDITWLSAREIAVLSSERKPDAPKPTAKPTTATPTPTKSGPPQPSKPVWGPPMINSVDISGAETELTAAYTETTHIAGAGSLPGLIVQSADDGLFQRTQGRWRYLKGTQGLTYPRFPG